MTESLRELSVADRGAGLVNAETTAAEVDHKAPASCLDCGHLTCPTDFELVDDAFDEVWPRCPNCQLAARLSRARCEFCDARAEHEVELGFLCSEHHDHYVDGYLKHD